MTRNYYSKITFLRQKRAPDRLKTFILTLDQPNGALICGVKQISIVILFSQSKKERACRLILCFKINLFYSHEWL